MIRLPCFYSFGIAYNLPQFIQIFDAAHYDDLTQAYRKGLADADRALAARCDCVAELCGGNITVHKGVLPQW